MDAELTPEWGWDGGSVAIRPTNGEVCHSSDVIVTDSVMENLCVSSRSCIAFRAEEPQFGANLSDCPPSKHELDCFKGLLLIWCPIAAITIYHRLSGFKQHEHIVFLFCRLQV